MKSQTSFCLQHLKCWLGSAVLKRKAQIIDKTKLKWEPRYRITKLPSAWKPAYRKTKALHCK